MRLPYHSDEGGISALDKLTLRGAEISSCTRNSEWHNCGMALSGKPRNSLAYRSVTHITMASQVA